MVKSKKKEAVQILKIGTTYKLIKVWIKKGCKSGVPVGAKNLKLAEIPTIGNPIIGKYDSEHRLSGDPKEVKFNASTKIISTREIFGTGLRVETTTSVYLLLYK